MGLVINLIWCQSENNVIGQKLPDNKLTGSRTSSYIMPWPKNKEDLQHFKKLTTGNGNNAVLMGYNTYFSLNKKPLSNRHNFVLTKKHYSELNTLFDNECNVNLFTPYQTIEGVINACEFLNVDELWIIGGGSLYELFLQKYSHKVSKIYRTIIPTKLAINSDTILIPNILDIPIFFNEISYKELETCKIQCFEPEF